MAAEIIIGRSLWLTLISGLRRRGYGRRESGAFLLARGGERRVCRVVYYDDLDAHCLDEGYIRFDGSGYVPLAKICQDAGLRVIADVHTHPGSWTGQSESDKEHPMMPRIDHVGLIVPNYAKGNKLNLNGVSAFVYRGDGQWENWKKHVRLALL